MATTKKTTTKKTTKKTARKPARRRDRSRGHFMMERRGARLVIDADLDVGGALAGIGRLADVLIGAANIAADPAAAVRDAVAAAVGGGAPSDDRGLS